MRNDFFEEQHLRLVIDWPQIFQVHKPKQRHLCFSFDTNFINQSVSVCCFFVRSITCLREIFLVQFFSVNTCNRFKSASEQNKDELWSWGNSSSSFLPMLINVVTNDWMDVTWDCFVWLLLQIVTSDCKCINSLDLYCQPVLTCTVDRNRRDLFLTPHGLPLLPSPQVKLAYLA